LREQSEKSSPFAARDDYHSSSVSSLFSILWRHCSKEAKPTENFFSDIVAELFKAHPEFLRQWLHMLPMKLVEVIEPAISIREHVRFQNGDQGFFDIFIRLRDGAGEHLLVVESKIGTTASKDQLQKYQDDLTHRLKQKPSLKATIIYITRDFERQKSLPGGAHFVQTRWEYFLQALEAFCKTNPSWFAAQVKDFMKEQRVAIPVQVTPAHLDAFLNFRPCLEMFDAVLDSELLDGFNKLGGTMLVSQSQRLDSLKKGWIYGLRCHHGNWQVGFHLGFWHGYPDPGVVYAGGLLGFYLKDPQNAAAHAQALSSAAERLETADAWKQYAPSHFALHPGFIWARPLKEVLTQENNAAVLRGVLQPVLDSMRDFQRWFKFPWEEQTFAHNEGERYAED
jgi:PD-(D/E)XK nuclease superfamily